MSVPDDGVAGTPPRSGEVISSAFLRSGKQFAKSGSGTVQAAANGSRVDRQDVGNCGLVQLLDLTQHQNHTLLLVQLGKRAVDSLAILSPPSRSSGSWAGSRTHRDPSMDSLSSDSVFFFGAAWSGSG